MAALDVLRGSALVGAFVVNMAVFSVDGGSPLISNRFDRTIAVLREVLTDGKWYPIFAFLFGYSLALQLRGRVSIAIRRRRVARRLFAIGLLGIAHGLLLYRWDILLAYGVLGTGLYGARRLATRTISRVWIGLVLFGAWLATEPTINPERYGFGRIAGAPAVEIYRHGSVFEVIGLHAHNYGYNIAQEVFAQWPFILAMMFAGLIAERHLLLSISTSLERRSRRGAYLIGGFSLAWNLIAEVTKFDRNWRATSFIGTLTILGQAIGAIALITRNRPAGRFSEVLTQLGRMSLTNYLMQSVICTTLAFGYGFGLGPSLTPSLQLVVLTFIIAGQVWFSRWWLADHHHGPVEGVLTRWVHRLPKDSTRRAH